MALWPRPRGVLLLLLLALAAVSLTSEGAKSKKRTKREWVIPPRNLFENVDYTHLEYIAKIRTDKDKELKVKYFLTGAGADKPPFNLFVVDPETGFVRVTVTSLDREKYPSYNLTGLAKYANGSNAEDPIPLTVIIVDKNDNSPKFKLHTGNITEMSEKGTLVMTVKGEDDDQEGTINSELHYTIISQEPKTDTPMFTLDAKTGELTVTDKTLDRELHDFYTVGVEVKDMGGGAGALKGNGSVEIKVLDINDNPPELEKMAYAGAVDENVHDVVVMRIKAIDKDLKPTDNWLARFTIIKGNEDGLFSIETDKETNEGILKLVKPVDFEEVKNLDLDLLVDNVAPLVVGTATLMDVDVQAGVRGGAGAGLNAGLGGDLGVDMDLGGGVDVGLGGGLDLGIDGDLNAELEGELEGGGELDPDLGADLGLDAGLGLHPSLGGGPKGGLNPSGPGAGIGLHPELHLNPDGSLAPDGKLGPKKPKPKKKPKKKKPSYPIKIAVNNVPEGPEFKPGTKEVPASEGPDQSLDDVIVTYAAIDPDTGEIAEDVNYAKAHDPDNWITIDEETAEIKLKKIPDRESPFLVNGTYYAEILAITKDMPSKTATGTIAIRVQDSNDHCPTLNMTTGWICADRKEVNVVAHDEDADPNGPPFRFEIIPKNTRGPWVVEDLSDTTAKFVSGETLWRGSYAIEVAVFDAQGLSCPTPEVFTVEVCDCEGTDYASCFMRGASSDEKNMEFSGPAVGLMLMAVCMLLFVPCLLIFCQCGGPNTIFAEKFSDLPFEAKEHLIAYHTEGRGEDKEVPLYSAPVVLGTQTKVEGAAPLVGGMSTEEHIQTVTNYETHTTSGGSRKFIMDGDYSNVDREQYYRDRGFSINNQKWTMVNHQNALFEEIALPDDFLEEYYIQKAAQPITGKDALLVYDDEGRGSPAGSVGCCSLLETDNDLQFLDDLGPKFKILAEICVPPTPYRPPSPKYKVKTEVAERVVEPVIPKVDQIIEKHVDLKTEKVLSSTNISKSVSNVSNVSKVSSISPPPQPPRSQVTNITSNISKTTNFSNLSNVSSLSNISNSNIGHFTTMSRSPQTIYVQQPQVIYAASPMPVQYIVPPPMQPQIQSTVLMAEGGAAPKFPGYIVMGGPQVSGQAGSVIQSSSTIIKSPGVSGGFTSGSLTSSPLSPTVFFSGSPSSATTSPTTPTIMLSGSPGSPGMVGKDGWKIVGPNPEGHYMLVPDTKSTAGEAEGSNTGSPQGTLPEGDALKKEAAPPQGVLGHAAHSGVIGVLSGHPLTSTRGLVTLNKPMGGRWVVHPQPTGLSPVVSPGPSPFMVLGAGIGATQNKGVHVMQSQTSLVQPSVVIPKDSKPASKQDTDERSLSRILVKKGKKVPKKINIDKNEGEGVMIDPVISLPQVQLLPPTPLPETVEEKVEITADPIIEQAKEKVCELENVEIPMPQTVLSESTENSMDINTKLVENPKELTGLNETTEDADAVANKPSTDVTPADSAEPKEEAEKVQLEEDVFVNPDSVTTNNEKTVTASSRSDPLVEEVIAAEQSAPFSTQPEEVTDKQSESLRSTPVNEFGNDKQDEPTSQDEVLQANDEPEPTVIEPQDLESDKDPETIIEDSPNLDAQDEVLSNEEVEEQNDTEQDAEPEDVSVSPENILKDSEDSQDTGTADNLTEAEQNIEIVEEEEAPLSTDDLQESTDCQDLETAEDSAAEAEAKTTSKEEEKSEDTIEATDTEMTPQTVDEKTDLDQQENNEQLNTASTDSPQEQTFVSDANSNDAEQTDETTDAIVKCEEASHQEEQPMATGVEEDMSMQEDVSSGVQEDNDEPVTSTQSTPVLEHAFNEEDETLEDTVAEDEDTEASLVEESNDTITEPEEEEPEQTLDVGETQMNASDSDQNDVEDDVEETDIIEQPDLDFTEEKDEQERVVSDDLGEETGSTSDQEQKAMSELNPEDEEEAPTERQDCNLEDNVENA